MLTVVRNRRSRKQREYSLTCGKHMCDRSKTTEAKLHKEGKEACYPFAAREKDELHRRKRLIWQPAGQTVLIAEETLAIPGFY